MSDEAWRPCSACKKPIAYGATYWTCSVSTCNRKRTALHFCTVSCWEVHLPVARHREAWAEDQTAPRRAEAARLTGEQKAGGQKAGDQKKGEQQSQSKGASDKVGSEPREPRRILPPAQKSAAPGGSSDVPQEILIVASRLKDYVRAISGFNTSDRALEPLSKIVRDACQEAVLNARAEGRKTILDRDVPKR